MTELTTTTNNSINEKEFIEKLKELAIPKKSLPKIGKWHIPCGIYMNSAKVNKKYAHVAIYKKKAIYFVVNNEKELDLDEIAIKANLIENLDNLSDTDKLSFQTNLLSSNYNPFAFYGGYLPKGIHEQFMFDLCLEILRPMCTDILSMTTRLTSEIIDQLVDHLDQVINPDLCFRLIYLIYQENLKRLNQHETFIEFMKASVSDYLVSDDKNTEKPKLEVKEIKPSKPSLGGQIDVGLMYEKLQEKGFSETVVEKPIDVGLMYKKLQEKGFSETVVEKPIEKETEPVKVKPNQPKAPKQTKA